MDQKVPRRTLILVSMSRSIIIAVDNLNLILLTVFMVLLILYIVRMDNIPHSKSVYLFMDRQLPQVTSDTGAKNLLILHGLNHAHYKYCQKKVKDSLTHFLPHLPGIINMGPSDNDSSLR